MRKMSAPVRICLLSAGVNMLRFLRFVFFESIVTDGSSSCLQRSHQGLARHQEGTAETTGATQALEEPTFPHRPKTSTFAPAPTMAERRPAHTGSISVRPGGPHPLAGAAEPGGLRGFARDRARAANRLRACPSQPLPLPQAQLRLRCCAHAA